jgi:pyruvate dehydrogenase E1 component alpha subunit
VLLEARCYRYQGHSMTDPGKYRSQAEADLWRKRDPVPRLARQLLEQGLADERALAEYQAEANRVVEDAMRFAEESPEPGPEALYEDVFVEAYHA